MDLIKTFTDTFNMALFKTAKRIQREAKYALILTEYDQLVADPDNDKVEIIRYLARKHGSSQTRIYQKLRERNLRC